MIVLILLWEQLLNFGHGNLGKVMEKVMESHKILKALKSTNPGISLGALMFVSMPTNLSHKLNGYCSRALGNY